MLINKIEIINIEILKYYTLNNVPIIKKVFLKINFNLRIVLSNLTIFCPRIISLETVQKYLSSQMPFASIVVKYFDKNN